MLWYSEQDLMSQEASRTLEFWHRCSRMEKSRLYILSLKKLKFVCVQGMLEGAALRPINLQR